MSAGSSLEQVWAERKVHVVSPNEQVFVTLHGDEAVSVEFAAGYYERATAQQLSEQLARTWRKTFVERTRAWLDLLAEDRGRPVRLASRPADLAEARLFERRDQLAVSGSSDDGSITVTSVGMVEWQVLFDPAITQRIGAGAFASAVGQAATRLLGDQLEKMSQLQGEIYGEPAPV